MNEEERLRREKEFHNKRFGEGDTKRLKVRKYYDANQHVKERFYEIISGLCKKDKRLLVYGCGADLPPEEWFKNCEKVVGIDISEEAINQVIEKMKAKNLEGDFFVRNAEETGFNENSFDVVVGSGIIHHLDCNKTYFELSGILKKDGRAIFIEPLGHNPIINFYRKLTPDIRTDDEHPLLMSDLKLLKKYFSDVKLEFYGLVTLLAVPFRKTFLYSGVSSLLKKIDKALLTLIPFLRRYAWMVIINAGNPIKESDKSN